MPVIKVQCLPPDQTEEYLLRLHEEIVDGVVSVRELGLRDQNDMTCLFVPDLMKYGLGKEIIVEVTGLYERPERTLEVRNKLARRIGEAVKAFYPQAKVEVFVFPFNPTAGGFWQTG